MLDFVTERISTLTIIPPGMLSSMMAANPTFAVMVNANPYRNGLYRAISIFNEPLSFGEFAAMAAPIGGYFILHGRKTSERMLGASVLIGAMLSLFVSGSRGGSVAFLVSMPLLLGLWVTRYVVSHPRSILAPTLALVSAMGVAMFLGLVFLWQRLYNIVFGGGDSAGSDSSRSEQWAMGLPHFYKNPIFGYGLGEGGNVVGWHSGGGFLSIDSFALNLLIETGAPGLIFYSGMIIIAMFIAIRIYLTDKDPGAEIGAPIASSILAYGIYRLVLSEHENQTLFYAFLALSFIVANASSAKRLSKMR